MRTSRKMTGCTAVSAAMVLGALFGAVFCGAAEATAQDAACEGGGYEGSKGGGGDNKADAAKSAKHNASLACSSYCAPRDACSQNKPYCKGTVKMGKITGGYSYCDLGSCSLAIFQNYTCKCACSTNAAQGGVAEMNVFFDDTLSEDDLADLNASEETLEALPVLNTATLRAVALELAAIEQLAVMAETNLDAEQFVDFEGSTDVGVASPQAGACEAGSYASSIWGSGYGKSDAAKSTKNYASVTCSSNCASLDACPSNKPTCQGSAHVGRLSCWIWGAGDPGLVWLCSGDYTCTCNCAGNH